MPNPQEIVAGIETFLGSQESKSVEELSRQATGYAALCVTANARLQRCADYLRRGLRSEAIYHAEINPDLLSLVATLDFSRFQEWDALCVEQGLERAPRLLLDVAKGVNEAYVAEEPLREHLAKLRLMSLAKVPARHRLRILRAIAAADPNNLIWDEDIRKYEKDRLDHIPAEAAQAVKANDWDTLKALSREVAESPWRVALPSGLPPSIVASLRKVQVTLALGALRELLPQLHEAYAALDYERASGLVQQWQQIIASNSLSVPDDLAGPAQPILARVAGIDHERERQQRFGAACAQLDRALDGKASTHDLRKFHQLASSFEQPVPEELDKRYTQEMAVREIARHRRVRLAVAGILIFTITVAAVAAVVIRNGMQSHRASVLADQIKASIKATETDPSELDDPANPLKTASDALSRTLETDPGLAGMADVVAAKRELDEALRAEADRTRQFQLAIEKVKDYAKGLLKNTAEKQPALAAIPAVTEAGQRLTETIAKLEERIPAKPPAGESPDKESLAQADALARTSAEKLGIEDWRGRIQGYTGALQKERDAQFLAKVNAVVDEIRKSLGTDLLRADLEAYGRRLTDVESRTALLRQEPGVGSEAMDNVTGVERQLAALRKAYQGARARAGEMQREKTDLDALARRAWSAGELRKALAEFNAAHPTSPKAAAFKQASDRAATWEAFDEWVGLVGSEAWTRTLVPRKASEIPDRIKAIDAYMAKYQASPIGDPLKAYKEFLEKGQAAVADAGPWKRGLRSLMNLPVMNSLASFTVAGGKRYYCLGDAVPKETSAGLQVTVVRSNDGAKTEQVLVRSGMQPSKVEPSPQIALGTAIVRRLGSLSVEDWHTFGLDIADLICKDTATDAILRATLLQTVLASVKESGWNVPDEVEASLTLLETQDLSGVVWVDPDNTAASAARARVLDVLSRLPALEGAKVGVQQKRQALLDRLQFVCLDRGMVLRDDQGAWQIRMSKGGVRDARVVAVAPTAGGKTALREVGAVKDGKISVIEYSLVDIPEGSMVFICEPVAKPVGR